MQQQRQQSYTGRIHAAPWENRGRHKCGHGPVMGFQKFESRLMKIGQFCSVFQLQYMRACPNITPRVSGSFVKQGWNRRAVWRIGSRGKGHPGTFDKNHTWGNREYSRDMKWSLLLPGRARYAPAPSVPQSFQRDEKRGVSGKMQQQATTPSPRVICSPCNEVTIV